MFSSQCSPFTRHHVANSFLACLIKKWFHSAFYDTPYPYPTPYLPSGLQHPTVSKTKAHPQRWRFITTKTAPWNSWMASLTQWTWVWANSGRQWRTGAWLAIVLQSGSWLRDWTAPTKSAPELRVRPWTNKHGTQGKTLLGELSCRPHDVTGPVWGPGDEVLKDAQPPSWQSLMPSWGTGLAVT